MRWEGRQGELLQVHGRYSRCDRLGRRARIRARYRVDEALISASVSAQPEEKKPGTSHVLGTGGPGLGARCRT